MRKKKEVEKSLKDLTKEEQIMKENELDNEVLIVKDPHTMMVPSEEGVLIVSGDFDILDPDDEYTFPFTLIIDFRTMEKLYSYMKFRQAEINFERNKY